MSDDAGKASKKNAKRQAARAKKRLLQDVEPSEAGVTAAPVAEPSTYVVTPSRRPNRIAVLREEMAAAKAAGDRKRAQEIREQIWLLNDKAAGVMGEGFERVAERVEETQAKAPATSSAPLSEPEKRLRSLGKKIQQIEKMQAAQKEGQKLEDGQLQKLAAEESIREEIRSLEELMSQATL